MVFTNITPFPYQMSPLTHVAPLTYRDAATFAEKLETLAQWFNNVMVPDSNAAIANAIEEFQKGIANAELTVDQAKDAWAELFTEFLLNSSAEFSKLHGSIVNVKDFGAVGNGIVDDSADIQFAADFAADIGAELLIPGGNFRIDTAITLKAGVNNSRRSVKVIGNVIVHTNTPAFIASGEFGLSKAMAADLVPRGRTLTVDNNAWFVPGETLFITSNDTVPNAPDKLGCLRKVISNTGTDTVNIDVPYYRTMLVASSLRAYKLTMHPGVSITGPGNVRSNDLENNEHLIEITLANDPVVNLNIGPSGGPGVLFAHCDGFEGGGHVHDLRDDTTGIGHYGYGWNVGGASRNGFISGTAYKCRHAFTTNTATAADGNFGGEPENIFTDIVTSRCSNKAIDSHRAGWALTHIVNDSGSYGALQVRADNVHATVYSSETYDGAVNVSSTVTVPPTLERIEVHGSGGADQLGVLLLGPAIIGDIVTRGCFTAVDIQSSGTRINSLDAFGKGAATGAGIKILGNNNTIGDVILENCGTGIVESAGSTGNIFHGVRRFTNCGTTLSLQAYNHMMSLRVGEYQVNAAALGAIKGRYPVYDNAGNQYGVIPVYTS